MVMLRAATQQSAYPYVFLQSGFLWLHPVITVLATLSKALDRVWCLLLQHWLPCSFCVCLTPQNPFGSPSSVTLQLTPDGTVLKAAFLHFDGEGLN